ncbi:NUDIX hydrolase [Sphingobium cupriresistens]|jgi:8-oxo-dGTP pyrophosphatase MutT (NUDIX family)|uniref:NUDIX hydrolase n=1 Tax=Sphingobium cupriresistens TaxID=1132417 RepID=UPI002414039E|nr:NUDIX hydrolase [Sphingobium cupriresistens]
MPSRVTALPYRYTPSGVLEVLLVKSRRRGRWILPKGKLEANEHGHERAALEAREEGGVEGDISATPLFRSRIFDPSQPKIYPLLVTTELDVWPEMAVRERAWMTVPQAVRAVSGDRLQRVLDIFPSEITAHAAGPAHTVEAL